MPIQRGNRFVQMTYQDEVLSKLTTRDGGFFQRSYKTNNTVV